jgi:hypothetical protein
MTVIWSVVGAAVILFALQAVIVAVVAAMRPRGNIYSTIIGVAFATAPAAAFADHLLFGRSLDADGRVFLVLMHLALGGFLFHFMTLPDRSVTLRVLVELLQAPDRALSLEELTVRYGVRTMITSRLRQLQDGRFLRIDDEGNITLLARGESFGRFVAGGRRLFRITSAN